MPEKIYSVSRVNAEVRHLLEQSHVAIKGELSEISSSGTWVMAYFSLKDKNAELPCVLPANLLSSFNVKEGQTVIARGRLSLYEKRGRFQLKVDSLEDAGAGTLQAKIEALKKKLEQEGLFAPQNKKTLPAYPETIGLITSSQAAAYGDFVKVAKERFAAARIVLADVAVQGQKAPAQIVNAIQEFEQLDQKKKIDLLVITRGGGSLEDLMAFNDEGVARTIARTSLPVISAIGHERDVTIADLVADARSSTPSNAAELALPNEQDVLAQIDHAARRATNQLRQKISVKTERLNLVLARPALTDPKTVYQPAGLRLDEAQQKLRLAYEKINVLPIKLKNIEEKLGRAARNLGRTAMVRSTALESRLKSLNPQAVLARGYSITRDLKGEVIKSARQAKHDSLLNIDLHRGRISVKVKKTLKK